MERRKLFSTTPEVKVRRKLFSDEECKGDGLHEIICMDCGYRMTTRDHTTTLTCPKCGGKRFNVVREVFSPIQCPVEVPTQEEGEREHREGKLMPIEDGRRSLFGETEESYQRAFSYTTDPVELKLKEFSGKTMTSEEFEKNFSNTCSFEDLEERGYCSIDETGNINIDKDAFIRSRMFSKIMITVTRELDLDPEIVGCPDPFKREMIDGFAKEERFSPKCIMIMKKGHLLPVQKENDEWIRDSRICEDLRNEFGGVCDGKPVVEKIIGERYPDAPEDILNLLKERGIIRESDGKIEIIK